MKHNLLLIDGHNFLFKAYGAPFKFNSRKGTPLQVVTVFLSLTRRAIRTIDEFGGCTSIAIVFDRQEKTSNHAISETYKANRKVDYSQDEDSPFRHLPQILAALKYLKIKTYEKKGVEADDLIASLATQYLKKHKASKIFIASTDSDFYQLLSRNTTQILFGKKGLNILLTPAGLKQKLNITPKQYVYFKSLTGDKSDNILGVPNVGPIRAEKIVNKKLPFEIKKYKQLLGQNQKLIELNRNFDVCKNWKKIILSDRLLSLKNKDIFQKAGL